MYFCKVSNISFLFSFLLLIYANGASDIETPSTGYIAYKGSFPFVTNCLLIFIIEDSYATTAS